VDALERLFRKRFTVLKATSGKQALDILDKHREPIALIITDQRMPEMTGVEFLEKTLSSHPETVRILLTGYTDLESVISAVNKGQIFRYITKPWDPTDLTNTVEHAVERFTLGKELKQKNLELARALEELKSLDVAKSNFMILINHELKTPLTSILSFTSLLSESPLNEEDRLMVNRILKSAHRLKNLIDDVLLIVRAETGQLKLDSHAQSFTDFDADLPKEVIDLITQKNLHPLSQLADVSVVGDSRLVRQVIGRLVHNAVKFANDGSDVRLSSHVDGSVVKFSVQNEGPKIPLDVVNKIMKPFYIDEDVMYHSSGTGLGLTICQAILKTHGSHLQFENTGTGVIVSFALPLA
jgi:signal transduction histidine kinase